MQLGWVEELGSGVLDVNKYWQAHGKAGKAQFIEGATFKIVLPVSDTFFSGNQDGNQDEKNVINIKLINSSGKLLKALEEFIFKQDERHEFSEEQLNKIKPYLVFTNQYWQPLLEFCKTPQSRKAIFEIIGVTNQSKNFNTIIDPLIEHKMLSPIIKDKPTSKYQKYLISNFGKKCYSF